MTSLPLISSNKCFGGEQNVSRKIKLRNKNNRESFIMEARENECFEDKLIDEIEQFPIIYDVDNVNYKKNNMRQEIWNGIAERLGSSSKIIQTKWKNIRYNYYKNKRDGKMPSESFAKKRKYTRDLSFLDKYAVDSRETCSNYVPQEESEAVSEARENECFEDKLIDEIEQFPIIYDVDNVNYRKNNVRMEIWYDIAKRLGSSSKIIQTKWKNIRYNYYKSKRDGKMPSGSAAKKRKYTRDLSFLDKYAVDSRETFCNYVPEEESVAVSDINNEIVVMDEIIVESSSSFDQQTSTPKKSSNNKRPHSKILKTIDQPITDVQKNNDTLDADDMFLLSYGASLRAMNQKEKNRVKYEITKIFKDAEY